MKISLFSGWTQNKILLVAGNIFLGIVLIVLGNVQVLPLDPINFIFFSFVIFLFALYRPGWTFLFFVGLIPFEVITLAPVLSGVALRPYQWVALLLFLAVILRFAARKLPFDLVQPKWFDWLLLCVPLGALVAIVNAPFQGSSLKQALVVFSFGLVYAIGRIFWQSFEDVKQSVPFFISSSLVVFGYALWQNLRFGAGNESFEVMAGRPNATFSEADWLGLFVIMILTIASVLVYQAFFAESKEEEGVKEVIRSPKAYLVLLFSILSFVVLLITVARSAWLGACASLIVLCFLILFVRGWPQIREMFFKTFSFGTMMTVSFLFALGVVVMFHLTTFRLFDRASSTASGLQEITIACDQDSALPTSLQKIENLDQLSEWHCRHIMLEDIGTERASGKFITVTYRDDPNISLRKEIYADVWQKIREYPVLGIGWGSVASFLGTDERGAGLNASNMFLEIWLGSGLIGLIAFFVFWVSLAIASVWRFRENILAERPFLLFIIASWAGITVFNLFNSGILLGFFFLYLALGGLVLQESHLFHKKI